MGLLEDKIEEDDNSKSEEEEKLLKTVPPVTKTSIQEIVEKHYAKPVLIENKVDTNEESANSEARDTDAKPVDKQGLVTDSVAYVLQNVYRNDQVKSELQNSSKDGIVTEALAYYFKGAKN